MPDSDTKEVADEFLLPAGERLTQLLAANLGSSVMTSRDGKTYRSAGFRDGYLVMRYVPPNPNSVTATITIGPADFVPKG